MSNQYFQIVFHEKDAYLHVYPPTEGGGNAKYVCTDSFHGTVFAIMMHRPFAIFQRLDEDGNMQSRFATLLHNVGIEERHSENGIFHYDDIHYNDVDKKLESLRQSSIDFLSNALQLAAGNE